MLVINDTFNDISVTS